MEKAVIPQISFHLDSHEPFQSGYKPSHSTETALLRVRNDILNAIDKKHAVFLVLLDLSAAFDTVDYPTLFNGLTNVYGISGTALAWLSSYLTKRNHQICVSGTMSERINLLYGLPQGSCVSPGIFTMYTYPMGAIIRRHNINVHLYADDTQLYVEFDPKVPGDAAVATFKLQACIAELKSWMTVNKLQLNESKTEEFEEKKLKTLSNVSLILDGTTIFPSPVIRNPGVMLESDMSMTSHVASISSSTNYHLRNIARIRRFIDKDTCKQAVRALITSRLDYLTLCILTSRPKTSKNFKGYNGCAPYILSQQAGQYFSADQRTPLATSQRTDFISDCPACVQMSQQPGTHLSH